MCVGGGGGRRVGSLPACVLHGSSEVLLRHPLLTLPPKVCKYACKFLRSQRFQFCCLTIYTHRHTHTCCCLPVLVTVSVSCLPCCGCPMLQLLPRGVHFDRLVACSRSCECCCVSCCIIKHVIFINAATTSAYSMLDTR